MYISEKIDVEVWEYVKNSVKLSIWNDVKHYVYDSVLHSVEHSGWIFVEDIVWNTLYDCTNKVDVTIYDYEY